MVTIHRLLITVIHLALFFDVGGIWSKAELPRIETAPLADNYVLRNWDTEDGLPDNSITSITQTPDGYLWLATSYGLVRFDGIRFTPFLKDTTPGLGSNSVSTVFTARNGTLWVGLGGGEVAYRSKIISKIFCLQYRIKSVLLPVPLLKMLMAEFGLATIPTRKLFAGDREKLRSFLHRTESVRDLPPTSKEKLTAPSGSPPPWDADFLTVLASNLSILQVK
jgi:ligand-binding sensor domain-containing protein